MLFLVILKHSNICLLFTFIVFFNENHVYIYLWHLLLLFFSFFFLFIIYFFLLLFLNITFRVLNCTVVYLTLAEVFTSLYCRFPMCIRRSNI